MVKDVDNGGFVIEYWTGEQLGGGLGVGMAGEVEGLLSVGGSLSGVVVT